MSANLKDLKDLLKLLRAQGVQQYLTPELSLVLNEHAPVVYKRSTADEELVGEPELSPEEEAERLLFYSATPPATPEEN